MGSMPSSGFLPPMDGMTPVSRGSRDSRIMSAGSVGPNLPTETWHSRNHVADSTRDQERRHTSHHQDRSSLIPDIIPSTVDIHLRAGVASDTITLTLPT